MEITQNIKTRQKTNLSVYTVLRPKDVLMSGGIVDYGSNSDEETCANISRKKEGLKSIQWKSLG